MARYLPALVLVADPPWHFGDKLPGPSRGAAKNYGTLGVEEICNFPLPPIADNAILFLWRVASMQEEALRVVRAWGFVPKTEIVWVKKTTGGKVHFGMGRTLRASHETAIVAHRGKFTPASRSVRSVFEAAVGRHSEKPEVFFELVEELVGPEFRGHAVELFARRKRDGWRCLGNEIESGIMEGEENGR